MNRKESEYRPRRCIVEKAVPVPHEEFLNMRETLMQSHPLITENIGIMYCDSEENLHCLLVYDKEQGDGLLIESEGSDYARYSQYIPNAKLMYEDHISHNLQEMKFICPLQIKRDTEDFMDYEDVSASQAVRHKNAINLFIKQFTMPEEKERGLMHWYREDDSVEQKVYSAFMLVEEFHGKLYGVITTQIYGVLTDEELAKLTDYFIGQNADGAGESLEQRPIKTSYRDLYVSFWNSSDAYFLKPLAEVFPEQTQTVHFDEEIEMGGFSMQ